MFMWGFIAVVWVGAYNIQTFYQYFMYLTYNDGANDDTKDQTYIVISKIQSIDHGIFYINLLVSAPAMATVVHLTLGWTEYSTIINTTLLISTMFAVDAFSAEMVNYWTYHRSAPSETNKIFKVVDERKKEQDLDIPLGMIRLTAFAVNSMLGFLFITLSYPISSAYKDSNSAVFVIFVLAFAGMLVIPDLLREFTNKIPFNSMPFRRLGDLMVRTLVLVFVYRASTNGRI